MYLLPSFFLTIHPGTLSLLPLLTPPHRVSSPGCTIAYIQLCIVQHVQLTIHYFFSLPSQLLCRSVHVCQWRYSIDLLDASEWFFCFQYLEASIRGKNIKSRLKAVFTLTGFLQHIVRLAKEKSSLITQTWTNSMSNKQMNFYEMICKLCPSKCSFCSYGITPSVTQTWLNINLRRFSANKFQVSYWKQVFHLLLWVRSGPQMECHSKMLSGYSLWSILRTSLKDKCNLLWQNQWLLSKPDEARQFCN